MQWESRLDTILFLIIYGTAKHYNYASSLKIDNLWHQNNADADHCCRYELN